MLLAIQEYMPDLYKAIIQRYNILQGISECEPIGRRALAKKLELSETILRKEVQDLSSQQLISIGKSGMKLTHKGIQALSSLNWQLQEQKRGAQLEKDYANYLDIEHCVIVPGDVDQSLPTFEQMGREAALLLSQLIDSGSNIVAVMGGSTMKMVAAQIEESKNIYDDALFVAARGGLNDEPSLEANVIAEAMAQKFHGKSRRLYAPSYVQPQLYESLVHIPDIQITLQLVENASTVLYSIGEPIEMAKRRNLSEEVIDYLIEKNVVAEAFGEFINEKGEVIYKLSNIGLQFDKLTQVPHVIIVAGGTKKAQAIAAHMKKAPSHACLITDEAAAKTILNGKKPVKK